MKTMRTSLLSVLLLWGLVSGALACEDNTDCNSCSRDTYGWFKQSCRWCALTNACHAPLSLLNDCSPSEQVTSPTECGKVAEPPLSYSPHTAEAMAKWSSLAYMDPVQKDMNSIQTVVASQLGDGYKILEYIFHDCDSVFQFGHCTALIAYSESDHHLVVAFRGTNDPKQLIEQVITPLVGMVRFENGIPGYVMRYNEDTHASLYPCLTSIVQERLNKDPNLRISVTGHSLGGAQASLAAVHLIKEGIVPQAKLELYTFGQPRVGNSQFAFEFDRIVGNSWRLTNSDDPVPKVVPSLARLGAYHTRREVFYNSVKFTTQSSYKICKGNEDKTCTESKLACLDLSVNCIKAHNSYFLDNLPTDIGALVNSVGTPPPKGVRGQCSTRVLSN